MQVTVEDESYYSDDGGESVGGTTRYQRRTSFFRRNSVFRRRRGSSSAGSSGGGLDPAFVEDIRASLMEYSRLIKRRRGVGTGLYQTPDSTHEWGQKQKQHHTNWSDLFFDLIVVGAVFQLGNFLSDVLLTAEWMGLLYFYSQFAVIHECWSLKLHYASRFNSSDVAHKLFDIVEALLVALMAGHLSTTFASLGDLGNGELIGFVSFKLAHEVLHMLRWVELWFYSDKVIVRRHASAFVLELALGTVPLVLAVVLAALRFDVFVVIMCLFASTLVENVHEMLRAVNLGVRKDLEAYAVPLHYAYVLHRYGEWTMLMLGEGVIQTLLVPFEKKIERYGTFVAAYLFIAAIRVLSYSSQPFQAQGHALSQSVRRGYIWLQLQPVESALIICVSIALKNFLKLAEKIGEPGFERYAWFFCASSAALLVIVWVSSILHRGVKNEFLVLPKRLRNLKIFTYMWKFGLSASLLPLPVLELNSFALTSLALLACVLQIVTHDIWYRLSKETELDSDYMDGLGLLDPPKPTIGLHHHQAKRKEQDDRAHMLTLDDVGGAPHMDHANSSPAVLKWRPQSLTKEGAAPAGGHTHLAPHMPAPIAALAAKAKKAGHALEHTFQLGQFGFPKHHKTADFNDHVLENPDLQADILRMFTRYGKTALEEGLQAFLSEKEARKKQKKKTKMQEVVRRREAGKTKTSKRLERLDEPNDDGDYNDGNDGNDDNDGDDEDVFDYEDSNDDGKQPESPPTI